MALLPVVALWALCPLLTRADRSPVPVTVTAAIGEDACLPCGTQPWADLRGATLSCTHQAGGHHAVPVLSHRLGSQPPPPAPSWQPPVQPDSRFRGRVAFCAAGTGDSDSDSGVSLLLRNLSHPDFGNYSCYASRAAAPQLLCSLVLQPAVAGVPEAEPDMLMVICVLTGAFTAVAIGVMVCARCQGHCWGQTARGPAPEPGAAAEEGQVALGDMKSLNT
ncbi:uncharacterized protein LOC130248533 [Oenanthe melanoleuca]|uniref:uncharacterized protein LOC130248533 n=1 Tax=Oenanthe melanoleuca TaxID=2939378 RepID=UPI0024C18934|nr:uncharacterized protein LOC130248533 [Oenanthe melanoleuca]XP_056338319.1 uncharacterized protein LOC130248533 [Oenanthe melanoleuca]